jgi:hypothetical protein
VAAGFIGPTQRRPPFTAAKPFAHADPASAGKATHCCVAWLRATGAVDAHSDVLECGDRVPQVFALALAD